jgi:hypothetical protein
MVIVHLEGGLGNQMDQYATGRCLAYKLNVELKLDLTHFKIPDALKSRTHNHYALGDFNILENFATSEEIKRVKDTGITITSASIPIDIQSDIYIKGHWMHDSNFYEDIAEIIRKEFTLKKPFSPNAEIWRQKILSTECSVSMHFRHGDYAYHLERNLEWSHILPLDYYYTCLDILKQRHKNITVFVFSDNLSWIKENLKLDVPMEFIEGCATDNEDFILMSLCKYNITANSTFSWRAAWLNSNPDKKTFAPLLSNAEEVKLFLNWLTPDKKETFLDNYLYILIPYDFDNQPEITQRPIFTLLLVVNDNVKALYATLDSLLNQDYKYYEVVIIDNASTDDSDKICKQAAEGKKNVTLKRLETKLSNSAAWNQAFKAAQGKYVSFLKVADRFLVNSLTSIYQMNECRETDIIHLFSWLEENENGDVTFADKKYSEQRDVIFEEEERVCLLSKNGLTAAKLLLNKEINSFLGTKIYNCEFLTEHGIKFDEQLSDDKAELAFQTEAFLKSEYFMYLANAFYVSPKS